MASPSSLQNCAPSCSSRTCRLWPRSGTRCHCLGQPDPPRDQTAACSLTAGNNGCPAPWLSPRHGCAEWVERCCRSRMWRQEVAEYCQYFATPSRGTGRYQPTRPAGPDYADLHKQETASDLTALAEPYVSHSQGGDTGSNPVGGAQLAVPPAPALVGQRFVSCPARQAQRRLSNWHDDAPLAVHHPERGGGHWPPSRPMSQLLLAPSMGSA